MKETLKYGGLTAVLTVLLGAVVPLLQSGMLYEGIVAGAVGLGVLAYKAYTYQ